MTTAEKIDFEIERKARVIQGHVFAGRVVVLRHPGTGNRFAEVTHHNVTKVRALLKESPSCTATIRRPKEIGEDECPGFAPEPVAVAAPSAPVEADPAPVPSAPEAEATEPEATAEAEATTEAQVNADTTATTAAAAADKNELVEADAGEAAVELKPAPVMKKPRLVTVRASDIQPEKIQWLWPNRLAVGKISLIAGNPGLGKSQLTVHIAAQVTTGGRWPNGEGEAPYGSVVILSAEDDPADTLVPRLIAAGADLSRVHIVEAMKVPMGNSELERQFNLADDIQVLCDALDQIGDVRVVVIDPVTAYLGTGKSVDSHKNSEVRAALAPLQARAAKLEFAAIGVSHLNKGGGTEALMRVLGSLAFVAAARVAFLVVGDKDTDRSLFIPMKNNIGAKRPGLGFRVVSQIIADDIETSCIEWDADEVTTSADEALAAAAGRGGDGDTAQSSVPEAMNFLRDVLSEGPVAAKSVQQQAKEAGISKATLRRAQKLLGVKAHHDGKGGDNGKGAWVWEMPEQVIFRSRVADE